MSLNKMIETSLRNGRTPRSKNPIKTNALFNKGIKTTVLGLSLFLGACATVNKQASTQVETQAALEKKTSPAVQQPAPTAKELMKTLKAPATNAVTAQAPVVPAQTAPIESAKVVSQAVETAKSAETSAVALSQEVASKAAVESKKIEVAAAQKAEDAQAQSISVTKVEPFSITKKKLPFKNDIWTIREGNTPLTKGLVIMTPTWEMGKEGYMSQIWLTLMEDKIHVNSSSDIASASKGLGIKIDGGELIPFSSIAENNIAVLNGKYLDRLAAAKKVDIYLGFFPGKKPLSDTFSSDLSLNNLAKMVATYRLLNK